MIRIKKDDLVRIETEWFKNHIANLETLRSSADEKIQILDWRNPGTCNFAMRIIFSRNNVIVTGDTGDTVFDLTEKAALETVKNYDQGYFLGKLRCAESGTKGVEFDGETAAARIEEEFKEQLADPSPEDLEEMSLVDKLQHQQGQEFLARLRDAAASASSQQEWNHEITLRERELSRYDADYWEWISGCGNVYTPHVLSILIAIKMAAKQLNI